MHTFLRTCDRIVRSLPMALAVLVLLFLIMGMVAMAVWLSGANVPVLEPAGLIAREQKTLLLVATGLMLIVIIPVFALTFFVAIKFRASNTNATYRPTWDSDKRLEAVWWGVPFIIIVILAVITWNSSHELDPYRPLVHKEEPVKIQVIALQWKWLFLYPEENVASIDEVSIPHNVPVQFEITADAPMNSFWIPSLAGQVYAMGGMTTKLHVIGDTIGTYRGSSANISGEGFANMDFEAKVSSFRQHQAWIDNAQRGKGMNAMTYAEIKNPSSIEKPAYYALEDPNLYQTVIHSYMHPTETSTKKQEHAYGH